MNSKPAPWGNFKALKDETHYRLIWRSYGKDKVGKTHFGLSGPGPIAIQSFDIGLEGVVEKVLRGGKSVLAANYEYVGADATQREAQEIRARFIADYDVALQQARTIIWDTETELWELFRHAEFGTNQQGVATDAPKDYVKLNASYRDLIQKAYKSNVNLQLIQKVKERWGVLNKERTDENGFKKTVQSPYATGEFEPAGMKESGYIVQMTAKHTWNKDDGFGIEIVNCRQNMGLAGETFYNMNFAEIGQLVFPDSEESDWV